MIDHHKFPKAHKPNEGRASESTAGDPAAVPASQVNVSAVDNTPHTKTDAEPKPRRSTGDIVGIDTMDVAVETNIVKLADTFMQVLKNQITIEAEIHNDLEEVVKSQPLAKNKSSKPPLNQAALPPHKHRKTCDQQ